MSNVIELFTPTDQTYLDVQASTVLEAALNNADLSDVVIIGKQTDGDWYFATTTSNIGRMLLMLERFKERILKND